MDQKTPLTPIPAKKNSLKETLINSLKTGDKASFLTAIAQANTFMLRDEKGNSLLHLAVNAPKDALFFTTTLLELNKIPINTRNDAKKTPLYLAVKRGDITMIRLLMADNANPHAQNQEGETPISLAISGKKSNILAVFTGVAVVDVNLERLKLRENIVNLTDEINLLTETLNKLPRWFQKLPADYHAALLNLQKSLHNRHLIFDSGEEVKTKKPKDDSSSSKSKKIEKFSASIKSMVEKEKKNKRIIEILGLLNDLITSLKKEKNDQYKEIETDLERLVGEYKSPFDEDKKIVKQLRVQIPSFGYRDLNPAVAKRFTRYFMNDDERKTQVNYKTNEHGLHDVIQINRVHYKINPTAPGIEYAVHALGELFTGQASTPTELLIVEQSTVNEQNETEVQFLPVIASQTVSGTLFHDLIEQDPTTAQKIDSHSFSLRFVLDLLTCPTDEKPSNSIAIPQFNEQGELINHVLVSIDSDEAFAEPICATKGGVASQIKHLLTLKTFIFCLSQMDDPIDIVLRRQLLKLHPVTLVLDWLQLLKQHNETFEKGNITTQHLKKVFSEVGLPQQLVPKTAVKLYRIFCQIQTLLRDHPELTHKELLEKCYPLVKIYYDYVLQESHGDLTKAMDLIYRGNFFEDLTLSEAQRTELNKFSNTISAYKNKREQSITQAIEEFCETLDFGQFDIETQQSILKELIIAFPDITHLTLKRCDALNDATLEEMSKHFKHLTHITLHHCRMFTAKGIHALLQRLPTLEITIEDFDTLKPHDLLTISRFCPRFFLILSNKTQWINHKNEFLLPFALEKNDINLTTFLLLAGFHLTKEKPTYSPLHNAIEQRNASLVKELISYYSNTNQYIGQLSPLDKAYQLLGTTSSAKSIQQLYLIIAFLLEAGAVALEGGAAGSASAKAILEIGRKSWEAQFPSEDKSKLAKALINFALTHKQLNAELVNKLVDINDDIIDWSHPSPLRSDYQVSDETFKALFTRIKSATKPIQILNLSNCPGITQQHIQICSQLNIKTLILDFQQAIETGLIKEPTLSNLLKSKGIQVQINAIELIGKTAVEKHFDEMIQVLSQPENNVKRLEITNCALSKDQIQRLSHAISQQSQIKRVVLHAVGLRKETTFFPMLMAGLDSSALIELCLDQNDLIAQDMIILVGWLKYHPELMELSLYGNPLGDGGIFALGFWLPHCQKLKKLNINQVDLTDEGFEKWLFGYASGNTLMQTHNKMPPQLSFLDIGFNKLTAKSASNVMETIRLNESLSQFLYAGQPELEKAISSTKLTTLLQRNARLDLQQILLEPYQQYFFKTNLQKQNVPAVSTASVKNPLESQAILAMKELMTTFEEEKNEIDQMTKWLYQEEKRTLIERDIDYNDFDQAALEQDILHLEKNNDKTSQEQIIQLKKQIQMLKIQQDALQLQYDRKVTYQAAISALNQKTTHQTTTTAVFTQNAGFRFFYCKMRLKLETLFTQCKLAMNAPVTQVVFDQKIILDQNLIKYIDQLGTLKTLLKVAEKTTHNLTETFKTAISNITKESKSLDAKTKEQIESLVETTMTRILKALGSHSIQGNTVSSLANKLISAAYYGAEVEVAVVLTPESEETSFFQSPFQASSSSASTHSPTTTQSTQTTFSNM